MTGDDEIRNLLKAITLWTNTRPANPDIGFGPPSYMRTICWEVTRDRRRRTSDVLDRAVERGFAEVQRGEDAYGGEYSNVVLTPAGHGFMWSAPDHPDDPNITISDLY